VTSYFFGLRVYEKFLGLEIDDITFLNRSLSWGAVTLWTELLSFKVTEPCLF